MAKIFVTRMFPGPGLEMIRASGHEATVNPEDRVLMRAELLRGVVGCDGILPQLLEKMDEELMTAAGNQLKVISNYAVGYNNIDVPAATARGILVCNTPGVLTDATADIAWLLLLGVARRAHEGERIVRTGEFRTMGWGPAVLLGGDVVGRTLAIIGAGRIGYATAKRAVGWDMKILYVARARHENFELDFGAKRAELDEALHTADFVSIHVPLNDQTRHLIDERRMRLMKKTAYLINTARGPIVDEAALVRVLREGAIAGAGLDVYEREPEVAEGLVDCPNTLLLPHLGSATIQTRSEMGRLAAQNLLNVLAEKAPLHAVNEKLVKPKGWTVG